MTFLNPFILFGLAAAAIPIILHLLNLRKLRTIEFSTLTFLKELQRTRIRRLKIRQILLLIVRTLLVIFIVLAFSRPALQGTFLGTIGSNAHSTIVLILDDSFSMSPSGERGELFREAKERMNEVIALMKEADEAYLVKLSDLPAATIEPATHDVSALSAVVREAEISPVTRPIEDALRLTARLLSASKNANHEVYLFSDFQKTLIPPASGSAAAAGAMLFEPHVRFFLIDIGDPDRANLAIDSIAVKSQILEKNKPLQIAATIRNYSNSPVQRAVVSVYLDETRLAQGSIDADPWSSATVDLTLTPPRSGRIRGRVVIEEDAIGQDNQRFFTLTIPEKIVVLSVSSTMAELKYPLLALEAEGGSQPGSIIEIRRANTSRLSLSELRDVDVVLLSGFSGLSEIAAGVLEGFVRQRGGLIMFPEPGFTGSTESVLLQKLGIPPPASVLSSSSGQATLSFRKIDEEHPLFLTVFEKEERSSGKRSLESPALIRSLVRQAGREGRSIIELGDGSPFLSEHRPGKGKVLFFSVAPDLMWSDFPLKALFAPLLHRSVIYTASTAGAEQVFTAGDDVVLKAPVTTSETSESRFTLVSPDNTEEMIMPVSSTKGGENQEMLVFSPVKLDQLGIYALRKGDKVSAYVSVNANPGESETRKIPQDDLDAMWERLGVQRGNVQTLTSADGVGTTVLESRFGVELWKHCLVIALLLALLEMILARDSRKELQQATAVAGAS